jgi:ribonuclease P protein component
MIAQKYRFHGHGSLRYLYRHGENVRTRTLTIRYIKNARRERPRLTVIVAKKVLKKAVKRNRIRRRLYEMLRELLPQLPANTDIAITVFSAELLLMSHDELKEQLIQALERAELLR